MLTQCIWHGAWWLLTRMQSKSFWLEPTQKRGTDADEGYNKAASCGGTIYDLLTVPALG